ncbi:hypothetical protein FQA39_LY19091 [Lamprigera yunnana]|nr:hypothetical protein FQA39_LY19091 [Lamprigera yunnana]
MMRLFVGRVSVVSLPTASSAIFSVASRPGLAGYSIAHDTIIAPWPPSGGAPELHGPTAPGVGGGEMVTPAKSSALSFGPGRARRTMSLVGGHELAEVHRLGCRDTATTRLRLPFLSDQIDERVPKFTCGGVHALGLPSISAKVVHVREGLTPAPAHLPGCGEADLAAAGARESARSAARGTGAPPQGELADAERSRSRRPAPAHEPGTSRARRNIVVRGASRERNAAGGVGGGRIHQLPALLQGDSVSGHVSGRRCGTAAPDEADVGRHGVELSSAFMLFRHVSVAILGCGCAASDLVPEGLSADDLDRLRGRLVFARAPAVPVQELPAIEGLARCERVCADRTGTLTETVCAWSEVDVYPAQRARDRAGDRNSRLSRGTPCAAYGPSQRSTPPRMVGYRSPRQTHREGTGSSAPGRPPRLGLRSVRGVPPAGFDRASCALCVDGCRGGHRGRRPAGAWKPGAVRFDRTGAAGGVSMLGQRSNYFESQGGRREVISGDNGRLGGGGSRIPGAGIPDSSVDSAKLVSHRRVGRGRTDNVTFGRVRPDQAAMVVRCSPPGDRP